MALFNPPSHDGGYNNGDYCIPARGHRGRSDLNVGVACQGFFRPGQFGRLRTVGF